MVRQHNSHVVEERLLLLEEILHNSNLKENLVQEVASQRSNIVTPKLATSYRDTTPRSSSHHRSQRRETRPPSHEGCQGSHATP